LFAGVTFALDVSECPVATSLASLYSGYKKKHTLKYECGCKISTGRIVWAPVPGLLGTQADVDCFYFYQIYKQMQEGEKFVGDGHYIGLPKSLVQTPQEMTVDIGHVRAIIEHVFHRIKEFDCLAQPWRHGVEHHWIVWKIVVNITNIKFEFDPVHKLPHPLLDIKQ